MPRIYILYDGRAAGGVGTDDASVLEVCESEAQAKREAPTYGQAACYSYEDNGKNELTDERYEWG